MAKTAFKTGDIVVEPSIGICTIIGMRRMKVDGQEDDYFILNPPSGTSKVYVPREMMIRRGVRPPMDKERVRRLLGYLKTPIQVSREDARQQYLQYKEILKSGDPVKISHLLRELYLLDQSDDLKGKEREIMEQAKAFLIEEMVYVREMSKTKAAQSIDECLHIMYKTKQSKEKQSKEKKESKDNK